MGVSVISKPHILPTRWPIVWLTPRFPLEMAAASALTLGAVLIVGEGGRAPPPEAAPAKVALQAPPRIIPLPTKSDERTREFI